MLTKRPAALHHWELAASFLLFKVVGAHGSVSGIDDVAAAGTDLPLVRVLLVGVVGVGFGIFLLIHTCIGVFHRCVRCVSVRRCVCVNSLLCVHSFVCAVFSELIYL